MASNSFRKAFQCKVPFCRMWFNPWALGVLLGFVLCLFMCFVLWAKVKGLEYILLNYRWIFVTFFLLPVSLIYDILFYVRNWLIFKLNSAPSKHYEKVAHVQQQVLPWIHKAWSNITLTFCIIFSG